MEFNLDTSRSIVQELFSDDLQKRKVRLFVKRDDLIDSEISGNKWRKLKFNVLKCQQQKNSGVLTFGGAFSNHLVATASACSKAGLECVGVVRGDELSENSNATLARCHELGMKLHFVSREEYHLRYERYYHESLLEIFTNLLVVPEGGANYYGMIGCQEIVSEMDLKADRFVLAQGTTTTSCGILLATNGNQKVSVVPAMKGYDSLGEMTTLLRKSGVEEQMIKECIQSVDVLSEYHFGGYAKFNEVLIDFIREFKQMHNLELDPVYTGKAMFALMDQIKKGAYDNETIVFVHTGGLQGIAGIESKLGEPLFQ